MDISPRQSRWGTVAALAPVLALIGPAMAEDHYWENYGSWWDTSSWDPSSIPGSGDYTEINVNPLSADFDAAQLHRPDDATRAEFFKSGLILNGVHYELYRIGGLVAANAGGPISTPSVTVNMSGSSVRNGIIYNSGIWTGGVNIGKNTIDGAASFSGGLWKVTGGFVVGSAAKGNFKQNGGTMVADTITVNGLYDLSSFGKLYVDRWTVRNEGDARIRGSVVEMYVDLDNIYGGRFYTEGSEINVGDPAKPLTRVFQNDSDSTFTQSGSVITLRGRADLQGEQIVGGPGIFKGPSARVDMDPTSGQAFRIRDTGLADFGTLEIGTSNGSGNGGVVSVENAGTLKAGSVLMGKQYEAAPPQPPAAILNVNSKVTIANGLIVGGPDDPVGYPTFGAASYVTLSGANATLTANPIFVSQSATGTGRIQAFAGAKVSTPGNITIGDGPAANGRIESYDTGSEIKGNQIWVGKTAGSTGVAQATNDGTISAPDTIILGPLTGSSDASLLIGGTGTGGAFYNPGKVVSPSIIRAGTTPINTRVIFQHGASAYTFPPRLQYVDLVTNTGPGRTTLSGRIWDTGIVQATAGTLEITHSAIANTTGYLAVQGSGKIEINGATLKTPDVAIARTLIGVVGSGTVTVKGAGRLESSFAIGSGAVGNSGTLAAQGMGSSILVTGMPLNVGYSRIGHLNVSSGGKVINNDAAHSTSAVLGVDATGIGDANIAGSFSRWDVGALTLGNQGKGTVRVDTGGTLAAGPVLLGSGTSATGELFIGAGGTVQVDSMVVGGAGQGLVSLKDGGVLKVGPTGQGDLVLRDQLAGTGILKLGTGGVAPGVLNARIVYSGYYGRNRSTVSISHQTPDYVFSPRLYEVDLQIASGNIGTTTLVNTGNFLSYCTVTSGGLRLAGGATAYIDSELVVGDGETFDLDNYSKPILEIDGPGSYVEAGSGMLVGKVGDGEVRLKNGGKLRVLDNVRQAENALVLGDDATTYGRTCSVIFGGSPSTAPGILDAFYIDSHASDGHVVFNHSSSTFTLGCNLTGSLAVEQLAGTTLLTSSSIFHTGGTSVTGGTLLVAAGANSIVTVGSGATFGGKGNVSRVNVLPGSTISPGTYRAGDAIASMTVPKLNFYGGSKVRADLGPNLTGDMLLNAGTATTLFPVTSGNVTWEFRNRGMNQPGVYPLMTTTSVIPAAFMNRLLYTSDFGLQGSFRQTRVTVHPGSTVDYSQLEFVVTSYNSTREYDTWATTTHGLDLTTTGAPSSDPDNDGVANMLEYILGSSPVSGTSTALPQAVVQGSNLRFTFNRRLRLSGFFTVNVEYSTDLASWTTAPASMQFVDRAIGDYEPITCDIPLPAGATKIFARLKTVSLAAP